MNDAGVLLSWLTAARAGGAVEDCGATAVFSAIARTEVTAVIRSRRACTLTGVQQKLLHADGTVAGHERRGVLYAGPGIAVAVTAAVLVPARIPARVRAMIGAGADGSVQPAGADAPLGRALAGCRARREQLEAFLVPGCGEDGNQVVIASAARLWIGPEPIAVVTEHVLAGFLAAFPGPWDRP